MKIELEAKCLKKHIGADYHFLNEEINIRKELLIFFTSEVNDESI